MTSTCIFSILVFLLTDVVDGWPCNLCQDGAKTLQNCTNLQDISVHDTFSSQFLDDRTISASVMLTASSKIQGMHNLLDVSTELNHANRNELEVIAGNCPLMLVQEVPSSFFIDQYEIARVKPRNFAAHFKRNIDVELPQYFAQNETVPMYVMLYYSHDEDSAKAEYSLSWHSRYHRCTNDTSATHAYAFIPSPTLYISCAKDMSGAYGPFLYHSSHEETLCHDHTNLLVAPCAKMYGNDLSILDTVHCTWMRIGHVNQTLKVPIPIGKCIDGPFVKFVTLLTTWAGTLVICFYSYKHAV